MVEGEGMKRWSVLLLCLLFSSPAWAGVISDEESGFVVECPPGWESLGLSEEKPYNKAILQSQQEDAEAATVFYVQVFDSKGRSLKAYRYSLRHVIVTQIGGKVLEDKPVTVAGLPARRLVYTGNANDPEAADYRFSRTLLVHKGKLYVLHGVTTREEYTWARPKFEALAGSFRLTGGVVEVPSAEEEEEAGGLEDVEGPPPEGSPQEQTD